MLVKDLIEPLSMDKGTGVLINTPTDFQFTFYNKEKVIKDYGNYQVISYGLLPIDSIIYLEVYVE